MNNTPQFSCFQSIINTILKSISILNLENYCIRCRHRLFGQTTKQPLNNFEPQKSWKYKQFWGLRLDPSCLEKNKCKKDKSWTT